MGTGCTSGSRDHHVVVGGGGFGGLQAVSKLRHAPVEVTLVGRRNFHLFEPLTYQVATGALSPGEIAYPLRAIFKRDRNVRVLLADVADFDLDARELQLRSVSAVPAPERLGYDTLIEGKEQSMIVRHAFIGLIGVAAMLCASTATGQTARDIRGPAPVVPLASEPAPRIVIDPPLAEWLAQGRVVIQYRAENLRIVPVFGPSALDVSPRIGHIHVTVDDSPWRWADASGEPLIINCLLPGPHKVLIELVNANHQTLERGVVTFVVSIRWSGC